MTLFSLTHWLKRRLFLVLVPAGLLASTTLSVVSVCLLSHHAALEAEQLGRDFTKQAAQHVQAKRYDAAQAVTDAYVSLPRVLSLSVYVASDKPWLDPFYHRATLTSLREELDPHFSWELPFLRPFFRFRLHLPLEVVTEDQEPTILGQANIHIYARDRALLASLAIAASFGLVALFLGLVAVTLRPLNRQIKTLFLQLYREASSQRLKASIPPESGLPELARLQTAIQGLKIRIGQQAHELQEARHESLHYQQVARQQAHKQSESAVSSQAVDAFLPSRFGRLEYTTLSGALLITERLLEDTSATPVQRDGLETLQKAINTLIRFSATPMTPRHTATSSSTCDVMALTSHLYTLLVSTSTHDRVRFTLAPSLHGLRQADLERVLHDIIGLVNVALSISQPHGTLHMHLRNAAEVDGLTVTIRISQSTLDMNTPQEAERQFTSMVEVYTLQEAMRRQRHAAFHRFEPDGTLNLGVTLRIPTLAPTSPLAAQMAQLIDPHRLCILKDRQGLAESLASIYRGMGVRVACVTLSDLRNGTVHPDILILPQASRYTPAPWQALRFRKYRTVALETSKAGYPPVDSETTAIDFTLPLHASPQYHLEQYATILRSQSVRSLHGGNLTTLNAKSYMERVLDQSSPEILKHTLSLVPASLGLLTTGLERLITEQGGTCQLYQRLQDVSLASLGLRRSRPVLFVGCAHDALTREDILFLHDIHQKGAAAIIGLITQPDEAIPAYLYPSFEKVISFPAEPQFITSVIIDKSRL